MKIPLRDIDGSQRTPRGQTATQRGPSAATCTTPRCSPSAVSSVLFATCGFRALFTTRLVKPLGLALESCSEACALVDGEAACVTSDWTTPPGEGSASGVGPTDAIDDSVTSTSPRSSDQDTSGTASAAETTPSQEPSEPPPVVIDPNNLFANASFEDGAGDWTTIGNAVLVAATSTSHTGDRSLLCQGRTQAWEGPSIEALPLVQRGGTYLVSGWVRAANDIGQPFHIVRRAVCLSDAGVEEKDDSVIYVQLAGTYTDDAWSQLVSAPFTVPDCDLSTFVIYFPWRRRFVDVGRVSKSCKMARSPPGRPTSDDSKTVHGQSTVRPPTPLTRRKRRKVALASVGTAIAVWAWMSNDEALTQRGLFLRNHRWVRSMAKRRFGIGMADVDDVVQKVFIVAYGVMQTQSVRSERAWLMAITRRVCANERRKIRVRRECEAQYPATGYEAAPDAMLLLRDAVKSLGRLDVRQRVVVELTCFEGLSLHGAASRLGLPVELAEVRLLRAKRSLDRTLGLRCDLCKP